MDFGARKRISWVGVGARVGVGVGVPFLTIDSKLSHYVVTELVLLECKRKLHRGKESIRKYAIGVDEGSEDLCMVGRHFLLVQQGL